MQENLVIVESPAKAKTIEKFLGKDFKVCSSYGHVRDLEKKDLGIDVQNHFLPHYEVAADKKKLVAELNKLARQSQCVWLASDEDREGEAIAWHLTEVLGLPVDQTKRIVFHEITKSAILKAIETPRTVDMNLVNAQQARRVLDRLVGFELSPVLWKKVKPSLSAGRVQSVAVRVLVDREREIIGFKSVAFFKVTAQFFPVDDPKKSLFKADLDCKFDTVEQAQAFLESCRNVRYTVVRNETKPAERFPAAPFTTSTLQQEASRKLGMSVSQTMSVAQRLYESGLITYMRTDSVNLSSQALAAAKQEIVALFGENYSKPRNFKTKSKGAQEAHEAIRPTYLNNPTIDGTPQEKRLYDLIWKRTVASQMAEAKIDRTTVGIAIENHTEQFQAVGEVILFDGFMKLYSESREDETDSEEGVLPAMKCGDLLSAEQLQATERFSQPPYRLSEAQLVKRLEELGIGRPSTYAPIITTIINRGYVVKQNRDGVKRDYRQLTMAAGKIVLRTSTETVGKEKGKLSPTDIGMVVNDYLEGQFENIMDYNFTASVEKQFDEIAQGNKQWTEMIGEFYAPFHATVEKALETQVERNRKEVELGTDPKTGHRVSARIGRYGPMVQIDGAEGEKPRYAALKKGQLIETLTLEEALELFALPRVVGRFRDDDVVIGIGRFGPYARNNSKFTSLERSDDPYTITLERAIALIEAKEQKSAHSKEPVKVFDADPAMQILNGMYGPYISYNKKNYRIPKGTDPAALTLEDCLALVAKSKK